MRFFKFIRPSTGIVEKVALEKWCWEADYTDGTTLKQFDDQTDLFHQISEIDQSKLNTFRMVNYITGQTYYLMFNPNYMKLIHFYRNDVLNDGTLRFKRYIFGYEMEGSNGMNNKVLNMIMPDGGLVTTDDADKVQINAT